MNRAGFAASVLLAAGLWTSPWGIAAEVSASAENGVSPGERIYRKLCASCHGASGEGVKDEYAQPLVGEKPVSKLTRYIERYMPDEEPELCEGEDARAVAQYIYDAFYSPIAQARNRPPRVELSRLTVRQYRNAAADLIGGFRGTPPESEKQGLRGEYFNSRRPGGRSVLQRIDPQVKFDFGKANPAPKKLDAAGFAARWQGSVIAPVTGRYEFIVRTDHALRLWLNDADEPLIDAWVKSGDETEFRGSLFLIDGRAYPLRLEFTSRDQGVEKKGSGKLVPAFVELCWKLPHRVAEVIPSRQLSPERVPEVFVVETAFPPDDRSIGYERGSAISKAWVDATTGAAIEAAGYVAGHLGELAGVGGGDAERKAKLQAFCRRLAERAFRRPLSDEQRRLYVDSQFRTAPDLETAVKRVVLLVLKSPRFLYLDPTGGEPDSYAVASRLSFALWDSLPDAPLLRAAAKGRLASRGQASRQAERMIQDRRTRAKLRQFLHHWLGVEHLKDLAKNRERFPGFGAAVASDLRTSLDLFLDDVIWGETADFRQLLLSSNLHFNGRLAQFYGLDLPPDAPFQKVGAKDSQRAGVLSHPYLMAGLAYTETTSPIHRGVFLVRSVLGRGLRPPPSAFAPLAPDLHPDLTTRERIDLQTKPEACQSCHEMINPLGFSLENFDAVGRYREKEKGKAINATGAYELLVGGKQTFDGARELAEFLAGCEEVHRAFVVQLFHHLVKQPIVAYGPETSSDLQKAFTGSKFNVRKLVAQIATTSCLKGSSPAPGASPGETGAE